MPVPDHVAIANLVYRYAELIDAGDFDGLGTLFGDAVVTAEGTEVSWRGAQAITEMYAGSTRRHADGTPRTRHVTTNLIVEVDDARERATCRSYYTVLQQTDDLALQPVVAGRYHDEFRRDVQWRFTRRTIHVDLVGNLAHHLLFELPD
jgi:3-phenylpropionate/cinnamic acid dioxygenase small subunit